MLLILIRGLPGSGKSTLAKTFKDFDHYEADDYFTDKEGNYNFNPAHLRKAHAHCLERTIRSMMRGSNVVVSNTFSQWWEMKPYIMAAANYSYDIRILTATGEYQNVHGVPEEVIQRMKQRWEN